MKLAMPVPLSTFPPQAGERANESLSEFSLTVDPGGGFFFAFFIRYLEHIIKLLRGLAPPYSFIMST